MGGGNAMDAAITAAFVQGVVDPQMCGIGGGGALIARQANGGAEVIEFYPRAGSLVRPDQWTAAVKGVVPDRYGYELDGARNDVGYESVAVPAAIRGFDTALRRHGTISWREALEPAIAVAEDGFKVTATLVGSWSAVPNPGLVAMRDRIQATSASRRIFTKDGRLHSAGELLRQPELAATMRVLAQEGPDAFYTGSIGKILVDDLAANGSTVTADDLAACRAEVVPPLQGTFRGRQILTVPPPGGGACVIQMLNFIEALGVDVSEWPSPSAVGDVAEAMAWTFADRDRDLADPRFHPVRTDEMVSKERALAAARHYRSGHRFAASADLVDQPTTSHISVVDSRGNAVSLTHTLGSSSGVVPDRLGFSLNNYLNTFDPVPGRPNSLAPGKTRFTMMSPTIVVEDARTAIVVGAPGGTKIAGAVFQVLLHLIDRGLDPVAAVSAPRVDLQADTLEAEGRLPAYVVRALTEAGYSVHRRSANLDTYFAQVQVVHMDALGRASAASDPRRDGGAAISIRSTRHRGGSTT